MKKIIIIMISLTFSAGAFAQRKGFSGHQRARVHVYVAPALGLGFGYGYPSFGYPYFGYPYGYGFSPYAYRPMQSYRLNAQINTVKSEYRYKIKTARKDKSISRAERKQDVLSLKSERENKIAEVEKNYYKRQMARMNNRQGINNNQN